MTHRIIAFSLATIIGIAAAAPAMANTPFATDGGLYYSSAAGPSSVDTADFNRDGHLDVALADIETDVVRIRFGGPSPSLLTLNGDFEGACYVRAGDINGDGWTDVVGSLRGTDNDQVSWWRNPGAGGGMWTEFGVASSFHFTQSRSFAIGDLDGDSDADVVVAGMAGTASYLSWFENIDGTGTSWNMRDITVGGTSGFEGPHDVVIADFNEDGYQDVAAVAYDSDKVAWFYNDGYIHDGDTWYMYTVATSVNGALCLSAVDYDRDGDVDLMVGAFVADDVLWFENRIEAGLEWDDHSIDTDLDGVYTVRTADMDLDGDLDVLASGRGADAVVWYERNVWGGYVRHYIDGNFDGARSAVAADFDSDGDLDVVAAGEFDHQVAWWENLTIHSTASFADRLTLEDQMMNPDSVEIADIDQDGDLDIVGTFYNMEASRPDVVVWEKNGGSWSGTTIELELNGATAVAVADINGDCNADLVVAGAASNRIDWYPGDYAGSFPLSRSVATGISGAKDVGVADFDCDGDLDIAAVAAVSGDVLWFENDGGGGLVWIEHVISNYAGPTALDVADIDLDGNPDLVVADDYTNVVWALPHFGCGTVWGEIAVAQAFDGPKDVEVADFNSDGWPDVVAAGADENTLAVFLNDPAVAWVWNRVDVDTGLDYWGVAAADINRDGATDIVAACRDDGVVRWWRNDGSGTSWPNNTPLDTTLTGVKAVAVGDIDSDGRPDVVAAGTTGDTVALYEGNGGQYMLWNHQDLAPATIGDSETAAILKLYPLHAGISTDLDMELRYLGLGFDDGTGTPLASAQANALIENVQVWYDANGNGSFEPAADSPLAAVGTLDLDANGRTTIAVSHGGLNPRIGPAAFHIFFVVVETTADASLQLPNRFRITHRESEPVLGHYYDYSTIELRPMAWEPFSSSPVTCQQEVDLLFADGFESGGTGQWDMTSGD